jgi:CBS domain-containing protein
MKSNKFHDAVVADLVGPVSALSPSDPISRALGYLRESGEYDAIVEDKSGAAVVSVRDLLNVENIASQKVSTIMRRVPKINSQDKISTAASVMFEYRIRSVPVYDGSRLVGKITSPAIAQPLADSSFGDDSIGRIATPDPVCVDFSDTVAKAKRLMVDWKIDQLPILKDKRLVGVITSDSIAFRLLPATDRNVKGERRAGRLEMDVTKLSQPRCITNEITDSLRKTLENMVRAGSNYSVIVNGDEVHGIVTYRDFIKMLPSSGASEASPVAIVGLPDDPLQSEMARQKFQTAVGLLAKTWPRLIEARAIIKTPETKAPKKKYEVQVFLSSENSHHNYKVVSYDLAKAFEEVEGWIKKLAQRHGAKKVQPKRRQSARKQSSPDESS